LAQGGQRKQIQPAGPSQYPFDMSDETAGWIFYLRPALKIILKTKARGAAGRKRRGGFLETIRKDAIYIQKH
jgi:hypothetical protein